MKKILISVTSVVTFGLPFLALAAQANTSYLDSVIKGGITLLSRLLILLVSLSVVWFIWNVIKYAMSDDEEKKGQAKKQMVWGVIAIAVTVSVWGLVGLLKNAFGLDTVDNAAPTDINQMIPGGTSDSWNSPAVAGNGHAVY